MIQKTNKVAQSGTQHAEDLSAKAADTNGCNRTHLNNDQNPIQEVANEIAYDPQVAAPSRNDPDVINKMTELITQRLELIMSRLPAEDRKAILQYWREHPGRDPYTGKQMPAPHIVVHDEDVIEVVKRRWGFIVPSGDGSTLNFPLGEVAGAPLVLIDLGIAIRLSRAYLIAKEVFSPTWGGGYVEGDCQCVHWGFDSFDHEMDTWCNVRDREDPLAAYYVKYYAERYENTGQVPPDTMDRHAVLREVREIERRRKLAEENCRKMREALPEVFGKHSHTLSDEARDADNPERHAQKVCSKHGVTREELGLLRALMMWGHERISKSGDREYECATALAAALSGRRAKHADPTQVTPQEVGALLERLFKRGGKDSYSVDIVKIERKLVEQTDANGQSVLVPHYRFGVGFDYIGEDEG